MNRFGEWLRGDLTRFVVVIVLLLALNTLTLSAVGGWFAVVVGVMAVLVIALLAAIYVSGGSSR